MLLETVASPDAIICAVDYPQPPTAHEVASVRKEHPNISIDDLQFHEEREYVIDRRLLGTVTVVRRYQAPGTQGPAKI